MQCSAVRPARNSYFFAVWKERRDENGEGAVGKYHPEPASSMQEAIEVYTYPGI